MIIFKYYLFNIIIMKIVQSILNKKFVIINNREKYYVDYLNSDGQILDLMNRNNWEIYNEDGEELQIYFFNNDTEKEKEKILKNSKLSEELINFCIKNFDTYNPL